MATKKDLIEAQGFSRRRLLTAFTSGAPGGKELEPAKPLRAVVAGIALAIMVIVGGVFYGLVKPGLPDGWQNNKVILVKDTGARYLAVDGELYPIINATSARLLLPAEGYKDNVLTTSASSIADIPIGPSIGILGAPDDVPAAGALMPDGWAACPTADGTALSVPSTTAPSAAIQAPSPQAALVRNDGKTYVVTGGTAYLVEAGSSDAVLRAVGLEGIKPLEVDSRWLNLFDAGAPFTPLVVEGAGEALGGSTLFVGSAVHPQNSEKRFIVTQQATLAPLSELAFQLYLLGTGERGSVLEVTPAEISDLPTDALPAGGADWPDEVLQPVEPGASVCAMLGHDKQSKLPTTTLATTFAPPTGTDATVAVGAGALVAAGGEGLQGVNEVYVVDQSGTSFAIPDSSDDVLARLGYTTGNISVLTTAWMQFFASGPELTITAAGRTPDGIGGAGQGLPAPSVGPAPSAAPPASADPAPSAGTPPTPAAGSTPTQGAASADASDTGACEKGTVAYSLDPPATFDLLQATDVASVATGAGVIVAVVDSGIDVSNAHLTHTVVGGVNLVGDGERADGMSDIFGHGTSVAGVIAAAPIAGSAMVGLAPDARLLSVRVFRGEDEESIKAGFGPDVVLVAQGIRWAVDHDATVINVSMSGEDDAPELSDAVDYATANGALVVASAGNRNTTDNKTDSPRYPAADQGALAVAAVNMQADVTEASIHGSHVDVAAPGQAVLTSMAGGGDCVFASEAESPSYATAYASAAAALVAQAHPDETPAQWGYRLMASAIRVDPGARNNRSGWGVIQPLDAITLMPGSGERGPASPFTTTGPVMVHTAGVDVSTHAVASPLVGTKEAAVGAGIVAVVAMAALGIVAGYRRRPRPEPAAAAVLPRAGLLDAARADRTRLQ